mgnify:CR=1 FL=1
MNQNNKYLIPKTNRKQFFKIKLSKEHIVKIYLD